MTISKAKLMGAPYRASDVAKLLDTNVRRVEGWVEQGLLKPVVEDGKQRRRYRFGMEHVLLGGLILGWQRAAGEKSRLPSVDKVFAGYLREVRNEWERLTDNDSTNKPEPDLLLAAAKSHDPSGNPEEWGLVRANDAPKFLKKCANATGVSFVNLSAIARRIQGGIE